MKTMQYYVMKSYVDFMQQQDNLLESNLYRKDEQIIEHLTYDSKDVKKNTLFICKGAAFKKDYLIEAIKQGAICYISEKKYELDDEVPYIIVNDIRKAMPMLGNIFYNSAWQDLKMIGIGGTKGKSTSVYYMKAILDDYLEVQGKKRVLLFLLLIHMMVLYEKNLILQLLKL